MRVFRSHRRQNPGKNITLRSRNEANYKLPGLGAARLLRGADCTLDTVEKWFGFSKKHAARFGQLHAMLPAVEQGRPHDLALKLPDMLAQRGLYRVQTFGRTSEAALLSHRDEVTQVPEFHPNARDPIMT